MCSAMDKNIDIEFALLECVGSWVAWWQNANAANKADSKSANCENCLIYVRNAFIIEFTANNDNFIAYCS